ncbi:MAG: 16S rRNA (adenine(1518)-N(6)/adenine(1519)-N(6))-dimethyltransferase RsmA [Firmicutes bacterium]|nr:16S rRNA (adenine(1518)-N(6)/adenine(1519)-N(6))-dimethyltransferase RsmA [Bacillota bacterium]
MSKLTSPGHVSQLLARHQLRLKKKWGQHFLVDENILRKIVLAAELEKEDTVLEVGPGLGVLTEKLAGQVRKVIALEVDGRLLPVLKETLAGYGNVEIIQADALQFDYAEVLSQTPAKLVANLPYNVATPLLYRLLKANRDCFVLFVCLIQKEVAERLCARPGGKEYGVLSVVAQYAAQTELLFTVPGTVFFPRPEVSSAVVRLRLHQHPAYDTGNEPFFYRVVETVFAKRRKTLFNTLHSAFAITKEELAGIGLALGLDMNRRGETLSVRELAELSRALYAFQAEAGLNTLGREG